MSKPNEYDTYIIPPNFIEGGTFFGGLLKLRNTAEALVIVLAIGIPVFSVSALTLTAKIIILCLTALPLGIIALVGINGESLSSFIFLVLKYLCNRRISISPASKSCINVLEIRKIDKSVEETLDGPGIERSELAAKIQRLHIFFALLIPDMSYEEKQLLDDALIRTYARKGITHDNASLSDPDNPNVYRQMPVLGDLYDVLREESDTKRLSNIINRFVHGSASTFNQQTNVNLDNKFTVLDISELSGDLLPIGMFVALDFVWDKAKANRTEEKAIFIDECWQLIGGGSGTFGIGNRLAAEMVLEIFKTIRAYSGSGICATQDLNDFFSLDNGKYGKGIINNCRTKVILNLEDEEAQRVQQVLHLSEAEVMEITHFERGNGLISSNNNNITVEIKASPLERDLITTDRRELLDLLRRMKRPEA